MGRAASSADELRVDHDARWGVLRCLQMLVEEAMTLDLAETAAALERALAVGHSEAGLHPGRRPSLGH